MIYQLATIVVPANIAANMRSLAAKLDRVEMVGMFTAGLSATGLAPATHFISTGFTPKPMIRLMRNSTQMFNVAKAAWEADGEVFPFTQAQVTSRLTACTVVAGPTDSEEAWSEGPFETLARLGLKLVVE